MEWDLTEKVETDGIELEGHIRSITTVVVCSILIRRHKIVTCIGGDGTLEF